MTGKEKVVCRTRIGYTCLGHSVKVGGRRQVAVAAAAARLRRWWWRHLTAVYEPFYTTRMHSNCKCARCCNANGPGQSGPLEYMGTLGTCPFLFCHFQKGWGIDDGHKWKLVPPLPLSLKMFHRARTQSDDCSILGLSVRIAQPFTSPPRAANF